MKRNDLLVLVVITLFSVIFLRELFIPGYYTSHDGIHQVARLYYFDQLVKDFQFPPRWVGGLQNGFGYPLFNFSYHMPWFIAEPIHLIGFTIFDSIKITFFITFILSGFTMYFSQKLLFGRFPAFIGSMIYLFAPYRFSNIFVRGAIGDATSFIFPPIIFLALYKIRQFESIQLKWIVIAGLSFAGLLLSHAMIFLFYLFIYGLYTVYFLFRLKSKKRFILTQIVILVICLLTSSYYFIPSIIERNFTNFSSVMKPIFVNSVFIDFKELIYSPWGFGLLDAAVGRMSFQLGIGQWIVIFGSLFTLVYLFINKKHDKKAKNNYDDGVFYLLAFIFHLYLILTISKPFWNLLAEYIVIDFTWRGIAVLIFISSMLGGFLIHKIRFSYFFGFLLILLVLYANRNHVHINKVLDWPLQLYIDSELTTNTYNEYRPKWVWASFMDKKVPKVLFTQTSLIDIKQNKSNYLSFYINAYEEGSVVINTTYYPGWKVFINGKDYNISANKIGIMEATIPKGIHFIEAKFEETPLRLVSNLVSIISISICALVLVIKKKYE